MDVRILFLLLFAVLAGGVFAVLSLISRPRMRLQERVASTGERRGRRLDWRAVGSELKRMTKPVGQALPRPPEELSKEEALLVQAGIRSQDAVYVYTGARILLAGAVLIAEIVSGLIWQHPYLGAMAPVIAGLILPGSWLRWRIGIRQRKIEWGLPDFMDLSTVCVEAGLGLDQTIQRVGREIALPHPELGEELNLYGLEVNAGRTRAEALRNLAARTGVEELRSFAAVLIQADRFGTSVGQTLRVFADDLRIKRRQKAEETAAKLPVKMVFPLAFFVFPAILLVLAGPAVLGLLRALKGLAGGS